MRRDPSNRINILAITLLSVAVASLIATMAVLGIRIIYWKESSKSLEEKMAKVEQEQLQIKDKVRYSEILIDNFNDLAGSVYYGEAKEMITEKTRNFTGFALYDGTDFYLVTAGHCIEYEGLKYKDFRFKANDRYMWIYPELLYYENDFKNGRDFAIFYSGSVTKGLIPDTDSDIPSYILGNTESKINIFKEFYMLTEGESGSPVLDSKLKVIGIANTNMGSFTKIDIVLDAIPQD